jgi:3-hydroxymyristoyl/3-hydroxydecanoyl-(acyl carrier protein) dehydratase
MMIDGDILVTDERAIGRKFVSGGEPFVTGHFPGNPILPGVLSLECLSQVAEALARRLSGDAECAVSEIRQVRFLQPVLPGDTLTVEAVVAEAQPGGGLFTCQIRSEGTVKATGVLFVAWRAAARDRA